MPCFSKKKNKRISAPSIRLICLKPFFTRKRGNLFNFFFLVELKFATNSSYWLKSQLQIVKNHFDLIFHSPRWFITSLSCSKWRKRKTSPANTTLKNFSVILNAKENKTFNSNNFCTWKLFRPQNSGLADLKFTFQMTVVRMKDGWKRCTLKL